MAKARSASLQGSRRLRIREAHCCTHPGGEVQRIQEALHYSLLIARGQGRKQPSLWGIVCPSSQVVHESTQGFAHFCMVRVP